MEPKANKMIKRPTGDEAKEVANPSAETAVADPSADVELAGGAPASFEMGR